MVVFYHLHCSWSRSEITSDNTWGVVQLTPRSLSRKEKEQRGEKNKYVLYCDTFHSWYYFTDLQSHSSTVHLCILLSLFKTERWLGLLLVSRHEVRVRPLRKYVLICAALPRPAETRQDFYFEIKSKSDSGAPWCLLAEHQFFIFTTSTNTTVTSTPPPPACASS